MTLWAWLPLSLIGGLGLMAVLDRVRRHRDRWDGRYMTQIQVLKTDNPLVLPAVKKLEACVVRKQRQRRAAPFSRIRRVG